MLEKLIFFGLFLSASFVEPRDLSPRVFRKHLSKRSYECPLNFIKLGKKCYFVSKEQLPWQEAHFKCESMKSQLAVIKNQKQDELIKKALEKLPERREHWIGGRYNWQKKQWNWARSSKLITYNDFDCCTSVDQEDLNWSCIAMDPEFEYRWMSKSCLLPAHFICQRSLKTGRKKEKNYKKYNEIYNRRNKGYNDIAVPPISNNDLLDQNLKSHQPENPYQVDLNNDLVNDLHNYRAKRKNNRRNKHHRSQNTHQSHSQLSHVGEYSNGTLYEQPEPPKEPPKDIRQIKIPVETGGSLDSENLQAYQLYKKINRRKNSRVIPERLA